MLRVREYPLRKLLKKIKELVHAGNVRRITIKNESGVTVFEIPLTYVPSAWYFSLLLQRWTWPCRFLKIIPVSYLIVTG